MTAIYTTLINKINTTLSGVTEIAEVFNYQAEEAEITKYPAVIFYPESVENSFETNNQNFKIYNFKMYLIVGGKGITKNKLMNTVLAGAVDSILYAFDGAWNGGTIDGNRVWTIIDTGLWAMREDGNEAYCEFNIKIKLVTNN